MLRLAGAQIAGWRARLTVGDLDVAGDLLAAVEPLADLVHDVAQARRQLARAHAAAIEHRLAGAAVLRADVAEDERELWQVAARLRKIAGL